MTDRIPIAEAERLCKTHGYDQVIIYARRVGPDGLEWVTTYGRDKTHCAAAAQIGDFIGRGVVKPMEELRVRAENAERERDEERDQCQRQSEARGHVLKKLVKAQRERDESRAALAAAQAEAEKAKRVIEAAHEWTCDRAMNSDSERALFAALYRHDPSRFGRENCPCGESDDCDECASVSEVEVRVAEIEARTALAKGGRNDG